MSNDDAPPRNPIAEQDEAARRFEERTGRKSTDPAPFGTMRMGIGPDGRVHAETFGYDRDPDDEFDPFKRAGIERVHHSPAEIEQQPDWVFGRFPGGTDPKAAVGEVVRAMFNTDDGRPYEQPDEPRPDAIEANVVEREPCLSDEAYERMAGFDDDDAPRFEELSVLLERAICQQCLALMKVFNDTKVNLDCPRCQGTGIDPDANLPVPR